jgi:1-aminocyclopropane-1-carboxylate deaminase
MQAFYQTEEIMLDPLYTGKMMYGISDLIEKGRFVPGTKILAVHTGGLQGLKGIERKTGKSLY